jgi:hypothetical protein
MSSQTNRNNEHGQTVAAWVLTVTVIIGSALIALGIFIANSALWQIGVVVAAVGSIVGFVLHQRGYGQKPRP